MAGGRQESLLTIGQHLVEVKDVLEHGQFSDWCQTEFDMSQRTAQRMMQVAEVFGGKNDTVSLLTDTAMYLLSAPSTPEPAREQVIQEAQTTGKSPTKAQRSRGHCPAQTRRQRGAQCGHRQPSAWCRACHLPHMPPPPQRPSQRHEWRRPLLRSQAHDSGRQRDD